MKALKLKQNLLLYPLVLYSFLSFAADETPLALPDMEAEIEQSVEVEPILLVGNIEAFDIDFTPALEAMSIASYQQTPYYPILASAISGNLADWWQEGTVEELIRQYSWSKILVQEADAVARNDILQFEDNFYAYAELARELKSQIYLVEGGDFSQYDVGDFAARQDVLLKNYQELSNLTATELIPLAHLLARLQSEDNIIIVNEDGNMTIEGAWASAAITYMGLSGGRPANPDFSRLYPDLQELIKPFAAIEPETRFDIIDAAWSEWQNYQRLVAN